MTRTDGATFPTNHRSWHPTITSTDEALDAASPLGNQPITSMWETRR